LNEVVNYLGIVLRFLGHLIGAYAALVMDLVFSKRCTLNGLDPENNRREVTTKASFLPVGNSCAQRGGVNLGVENSNVQQAEFKSIMSPTPPIKIRLTAQTRSRLNQLWERNLRPSQS
jgi:hypothetical protein